MIRIKDVLCIVIMASMLFAGYGCGDTGKQDTGTPPAGKAPEPQGEKAGGFVVPAKGTPGEQVKKLWESTSPVMRQDAQAKLGDKEYQEKRNSLFSAWVTLQGKLSLAEMKDENASKAIPEVLKFIDNLYGFPGFTPERREKDRETAKKHFEERFQKLDLQIKGLK